MVERETYTGGRAGKKDQASKVGCSLVAKGARCINQSSNSIGLHSASDQRATPCSRGTSGLFGFDKVLLRIGSLGTVICIAEDRGQNTQRSSVGEDSAHGNSRGFDGREI